MGISHFLNKSVVIRRLSAISGFRRSQVSTGTVDVHIQRITDESTFNLYGVLGATHKAWTDVDEDIQAGDQIRDADGVLYEAVAVNKQDFGMNTHLEIILKQYDA